MVPSACKCWFEIILTQSSYKRLLRFANEFLLSNCIPVHSAQNCVPLWTSIPTKSTCFVIHIAGLTMNHSVLKYFFIELQILTKVAALKCK